MDERQNIVKKTFTKEQLEAMTPEEIVALVGRAGRDARFAGLGIVRGADGKIKYAPEAVPGRFGERPGDLPDVVPD